MYIHVHVNLFVCLHDSYLIAAAADVGAALVGLPCECDDDDIVIHYYYLFSTESRT